MARRVVHLHLTPCKVGEKGAKVHAIEKVTCMNCLRKRLKSLSEHASDMHSRYIDTLGEANRVSDIIDRLEEERNPRGPG